MGAKASTGASGDSSGGADSRAATLHAQAQAFIAADREREAKSAALAAASGSGVVPKEQLPPFVASLHRPAAKELSARPAKGGLRASDRIIVQRESVLYEFIVPSTDELVAAPPASKLVLHRRLGLVAHGTLPKINTGCGLAPELLTISHDDRKAPGRVTILHIDFESWIVTHILTRQPFRFMCDGASVDHIFFRYRTDITKDGPLLPVATSATSPAGKSAAAAAAAASAGVVTAPIAAAAHPPPPPPLPDWSPAVWNRHASDWVDLSDSMNAQFRFHVWRHLPVCTGDADGPHPVTGDDSTGFVPTRASAITDTCYAVLHARTELAVDIIRLINAYLRFPAVPDIWLIEPIAAAATPPATSPGADTKSDTKTDAKATAASGAATTTVSVAPPVKDTRSPRVGLALYHPERGLIRGCSPNLRSLLDLPILLGLVGTHAIVNEHADVMAYADATHITLVDVVTGVILYRDAHSITRQHSHQLLWFSSSITPGDSAAAAAAAPNTSAYLYYVQSEERTPGGAAAAEAEPAAAAAAAPSTPSRGAHFRGPSYTKLPADVTRTDRLVRVDIAALRAAVELAPPPAVQPASADAKSATAATAVAAAGDTKVAAVASATATGATPVAVSSFAPSNASHPQAIAFLPRNRSVELKRAAEAAGDASASGSGGTGGFGFGGSSAVTGESILNGDRARMSVIAANHTPLLRRLWSALKIGGSMRDFAVISVPPDGNRMLIRAELSGTGGEWYYVDASAAAAAESIRTGGADALPLLWRGVDCIDSIRMGFFSFWHVPPLTSWQLPDAVAAAK